MPADVDLFMVFGRADAARNSLRDILTDTGARTHLLARERLLGRAIPSELERVVRTCDAAVVLATADDVGGPAGDPVQSARARENIWIELGWFWAELGLERTLLITDGKVKPPSDLDGIFRLEYSSDPSEVRAEIREWLDTLSNDRPGDSVDLLRSGTDTGARNADYQRIHTDARRELLVTGIGMINVRQDVPQLLGRLDSDSNFVLKFLIPSEAVIELQDTHQIAPYRSTAGDLHTFVEELESQAKARAVGERIQLLRYNRIMTFVVTVSDLGQFGSLMLVELPLEASQHGLVERPRFLLRRRTIGGLYDRFASAIAGMIASPDAERQKLA